MRKKGTNRHGMKWMVAAALIGGMVAVLAGCQSKQPQTASLTLAANPTTGYDWIVNQDPEIFDVKMEYVEDENQDGMTGVGGRDVFTLTPKEEGSSRVTFTYGQNWEGGETGDAYTYEVRVDKDMQIEVEGTAAEMDGTMSSLPEMPELEIK